MTVINTGFRARKSFWLNAWSELLFFGLETELSGLAAKKLMY